MNRIVISCSIILLSFLLTSCKSIPTNQERSDSATSLASLNNWIRKDIDTGNFLIRSYLPHNLTEHNTLTIFIEGDGLAWLSKRKPSLDPTPVNNTVLKMALSHPESNAAYLARPCHFNKTTNCSYRFWLKERFSPVVIRNMDSAVDQLKQRFDAKELILIGYSGGGAIATLLASSRKDVTHLITLAGNLDHKTWTEHHQITPLIGSLNPIDYSSELQKNEVKQTHFIGSRDKIIPSFLTYRFANSQRNKRINVIELEQFDHNCCWDSQWPKLWKGFIESRKTAKN